MLHTEFQGGSSIYNSDGIIVNWASGRYFNAACAREEKSNVWRFSIAAYDGRDATFTPPLPPGIALARNCWTWSLDAVQYKKYPERSKRCTSTRAEKGWWKVNLVNLSDGEHLTDVSLMCHTWASNLCVICVTPMRHIWFTAEKSEKLVMLCYFLLRSLMCRFQVKRLGWCKSLRAFTAFASEKEFPANLDIGPSMWPANR